MERSGAACQGEAGRRGTDWQGRERRGPVGAVWQARHGEARCGAAGSGRAGPGMARQARRG
jgi:hypothetical protein